MTVVFNWWAQLISHRKYLQTCLISVIFGDSKAPLDNCPVLRAYRWRSSVMLCTCTLLRCVALFPHHPQSYYPPLMSSHTLPTPASSSNFQLIFDNALRAYERRTKKDLRNHPLAAKLQDCNSPSNILDVLQQQVEELNQSQRRDEVWTRWLDPTVNVLHAFSGTLGDHVTSVCLAL